MANKEKNTKEEPYLLQDEEQVGEAEKATYITYDLEDDRDSEEFEKEITKRKPEEVNIDPDSNTATVKEDEISEVEKTQVLKYDIKKTNPKINCNN